MRSPLRRSAPRPLAVERLEDRTLPAPLTVPGVVTVQSPLLVLGSGPGGGEVRAIDPATGQTTLDLFPFGTGFTGGVNVATADLTGDTVPDIVAGMASGGS